MFDMVNEAKPSSKQKYYGKYPALVLDNKARQGKHRGELQVEISGILEDIPGKSDYRPMRAWAVPCFIPGFFFIPEIGDQVWVEFAAGDINLPVWVGVWYPKDSAPQTAGGQNPSEAQKIIRTAPGNIIQLEDTGQGEKIIIQDVKGNAVTLDQNGIKVEAATGAEVVISSKVKVVISANTVGLGSATANEPVIWGNAFNREWSQFIYHTHTTAMGPTSPPTPPALPLLPGNQLSNTVNTV
jgi:hypothetical protein